MLLCVNWKTVINTLKVLQFFKMSVNIYQSRKHNNPEEYMSYLLFNVAPCMLPHLLHNPTHALFTL